MNRQFASHWTFWNVLGSVGSNVAIKEGAVFHCSAEPLTENAVRIIKNK